MNMPNKQPDPSLPYTLASRSKPTRKPKLAKDYGCPTARTKRKHGHTTLYKSNSGGSGKIKVCAFNKLLWWRTGNRLEIRYCSYTWPLQAIIKNDTAT